MQREATTQNFALGKIIACAALISRKKVREEFSESHRNKFFYVTLRQLEFACASRCALFSCIFESMKPMTRAKFLRARAARRSA
jgi:hypothetical protein